MNASTLSRMKKVEENGPVKVRTTDHGYSAAPFN
jgi:hypothetical protein